MRIFVKFIDDEAFTIRDVSYFRLSEGYWKIITNDGMSFFFQQRAS